MTCDPQLSQQEREDGFQQQAAVARAVRPINLQIPASEKNHPLAKTLASLVDYINRDLLPVVQAGRNRVNESYPAVQRNAPSGNPLTYFFSAQTANADPTKGFVRLDTSPQNTATTLRVSELNGAGKSILPWLDVMAGSSTSPLGVVTLQHAFDPLRLVRFNLTTMVDQGAYWDLGVAVVESSHPNPFADSDPVQIGFIAGVASGGVALAPGTVPTWASVLGSGNHSGAHTPIIDSGSALNFASGAVGIVGSGALLVDVSTDWTLNTNAVQRLKVEASGDWLVNATAGTAGQALISTGPGATPTWANVTVGALAPIATDTFVGNVSGATAAPSAINLSTLAGNGLGFASHTLSVNVGTSLAISSDNVVRAVELPRSGGQSLLCRKLN